MHRVTSQIQQRYKALSTQLPRQNSRQQGNMLPLPINGPIYWVH